MSLAYIGCSVVPKVLYHAMQRRKKGSISKALDIITQMSQYQHVGTNSLRMIKYVSRMRNTLR